MKRAAKEEWIKRLRSGEYAQGRSALRSSDGYCCLGILCEVAVDAGVADRFARGEASDGYVYGPRDDDPNYYPQRSPYYLPTVVVDWAGLHDFGTGSDPVVTINGVETNVSSHNDAGVSFAEIAQAIEDQVPVSPEDD